MRIREIIELLEKENLEFEFIGNENDIVSSYSTLFNYKKETLTFISTLNKFEVYKDLFKETKIKLIIMGNNEKNYSCFENIIKVEYPKKTFFKILDILFMSNEYDDENFITKCKENISSRIATNAKIGNNVKIGANCVIESGVEIGENCIIH